MTSPDPRSAPPHLVGLVAALAGPPPPKYPTGEPTDEQWAAAIRRIVNEVWSQGWMAGAAYTMERLAPPPLMLTDEQAAMFADRLNSFRVSPFRSPRPAAPVTTDPPGDA